MHKVREGNEGHWDVDESTIMGTTPIMKDAVWCRLVVALWIFTGLWGFV